MAVLVLSGVLVLVVAACGCVVWAARGGPRWVRAVAAATLWVCELVSVANRPGRRHGGPGLGGGE
ncbi:hypothetical protein AB0L74_17735 [Streptomyces sp. NPDC052020]|uniref:hypothetical protein n=1 Tax=Streptomyces sp. NPDC052020 TaxID=3155677 RepID=UPI0034396A50